MNTQTASSFLWLFLTKRLVNEIFPNKYINIYRYIDICIFVNASSHMHIDSPGWYNLGLKFLWMHKENDDQGPQFNKSFDFKQGTKINFIFDIKIYKHNSKN